jgi:hypothetical protein
MSLFKLKLELVCVVVQCEAVLLLLAELLGIFVFFLLNFFVLELHVLETTGQKVSLRF